MIFISLVLMANLSCVSDTKKSKAISQTSVMKKQTQERNLKWM